MCMGRTGQPLIRNRDGTNPYLNIAGVPAEKQEGSDAYTAYQEAREAAIDKAARAEIELRNNPPPPPPPPGHTGDLQKEALKINMPQGAQAQAGTRTVKGDSTLTKKKNISGDSAGGGGGGLNY